MTQLQPGARFVVTYTRGGSAMSVETGTLTALATRPASGCSCSLITFDRPGGAIVDQPGSDRIVALSGCGYHLPQATPAPEEAPNG